MILARHAFRNTKYVTVPDLEGANLYLRTRPLADNENAELWELDGRGKLKMLPYEADEAGTGFRPW